MLFVLITNFHWGGGGLKAAQYACGSPGSSELMYLLKSVYCILYFYAFKGDLYGHCNFAHTQRYIAVQGNKPCYWFILFSVRTSSCCSSLSPHTLVKSWKPRRQGFVKDSTTNCSLKSGRHRIMVSRDYRRHHLHTTGEGNTMHHSFNLQRHTSITACDHHVHERFEKKK